MRTFTPGVFLYTLMLLLQGCGSTTADPSKKALARVADDYLYASELEGLGDGMNPEDSALQVQLYIKQWVEDALIMQEGKDKIKNKERIDRLVKDFRTSLVREEYEQWLVEQQLDSIVSAQEVSDYYEQNKEQYQSGIEWVRCFFVKIPRSLEGAEQVHEWFQSGTRSDFENVRAFCQKHNAPAILDEQFWVRLDRILVELPDGNLPRRYLEETGSIFDHSNDEYIYLYRTLEYRGAEEATPLSKVKDEITRIILHQRRMALVEQNRKEIYERGKTNQTFELYE